MDQFDRYLDGRLWFWEGDLGQAKQIFEAMLELFPETTPASRLLESDLALIDLEERLAAGETVALDFEPEMMLWDIRSGDWTVNDAGELEFQFGDQTGFFRIVSRVRLGRDFEMSGELACDKLKKQHLEFGPMVGCHRNREGEQWISCLCEREFWGQWYFDLLDRTFASNFDGKRRGLKVKEGNVFSFRLVVNDGRISYWMNDLQIIDNHEPGFYHKEGTSDIDISDNDPAGIFLSSRWSSARATVRNLTVRKSSD